MKNFLVAVIVATGVLPTFFLHAQEYSAQDYCDKGFMLEMRGEKEAALGAYNAALALDSSNKDAIISRSHLLMSIGQFKEAQADIDIVATMDPELNNFPDHFR